MVAFSRFCAFALVAAQSALAQDGNESTTVAVMDENITTTADPGTGNDTTVTSTAPDVEVSTTPADSGNSSTAPASSTEAAGNSSSTAEVTSTEAESSTAASGNSTTEEATAKVTTAAEDESTKAATTEAADTNTTTTAAAEKQVLSTALAIVQTITKEVALDFCKVTDESANALASNTKLIAVKAACEEMEPDATCEVGDEERWNVYVQCDKAAGGWGIINGKTTLFTKEECKKLSPECTAIKARRRLSTFDGDLTQKTAVNMELPKAVYAKKSADIKKKVAKQDEWKKAVIAKTDEIQAAIDSGGDLTAMLGSGINLAEFAGEAKTATVSMNDVKAEMDKLPIKNMTISKMTVTKEAVEVSDTTKAPATSSAHAVGGSVLIGASVALLVLA